jgi:hypothetical protein
MVKRILVLGLGIVMAWGAVGSFDATPTSAAPAAVQSQWSWQDQGRSVTGSSSTVSHNGNLYVFTRRPDGNLWVNYWHENAWHWQDQGRTITDSPSTVSHNGNLYAFARRPDTNLWVNYWA